MASVSKVRSYITENIRGSRKKIKKKFLPRDVNPFGEDGGVVVWNGIAPNFIFFEGETKEFILYDLKCKFEK